MVLPLWRSLHSLNLMLPKEDRSAMLLRLYNDTSPLMDHSRDRFLPKRNGPKDEDATKHEDELMKDEDEGMKDEDDDDDVKPEDEPPKADDKDKIVAAAGLGPSVGGRVKDEDMDAEKEAEEGIGAELDVDDVE